MPTIKPYAGESHDRLTALINLDNQTNLVEGIDFNFGPVSEFAGNGNRNSRVTIVPTDANILPATISYRRLSATVLNNLPAGEIAPVILNSFNFDTYSILANINSSLGLDLTSSEVDNTIFNEARLQYPLNIVSGSLAWIPSTYNYKVDSPLFIHAENNTILTTQNGFPFELEGA